MSPLLTSSFFELYQHDVLQKVTFFMWNTFWRIKISLKVKILKKNEILKCHFILLMKMVILLRDFFKNFDGRFETLNLHGFLIFLAFCNAFDLNNQKILWLPWFIVFQRKIGFETALEYFRRIQNSLKVVLNPRYLSL